MKLSKQTRSIFIARCFALVNWLGSTQAGTNKPTGRNILPKWVWWSKLPKKDDETVYIWGLLMIRSSV